MALKATIFKVSVAISDMDRHYYQTHRLTLAQHPSETKERMMVRLVGWILQASESLEFTRGLSSTDEPDLWERDATGSIQHWIELGHPDEKRLRKASSLAKKVDIYTYQGRTSAQWWDTNQEHILAMNRIRVFDINPEDIELITSLYQRTMDLQAIIQDGTLWLSDNNNTVELTPDNKTDNT